MSHDMLHGHLYSYSKTKRTFFIPGLSDEKRLDFTDVQFYVIDSYVISFAKVVNDKFYSAAKLA